MTNAVRPPTETPPHSGQTRTCIACSSDRTTLLFTQLQDYEFGLGPGTFSFVRCDTCGLIRLDPMPGPSELQTFYSSAYHTLYGGRLKKSLITFLERHALKELAARLQHDARILDVGCSTGEFMKALAAKYPGWRVAGLEMNAESARVGRGQGCNIIEGNVETSELPQEQYDAIVLRSSIEHFEDPLRLLERLGLTLKPRGLLYITTPNTACADLGFWGKYWGHLHYPRHTYLYNADNLARLLTRGGFTVCAVQPLFCATGWSLGMQNALADRFGLRVKEGRAWFYYALFGALFPVAVIQWLFGGSSMLWAIARRNEP
jgi:2-polyprenyl-3-methyl-5-hydroxy-6-metoxy-1,4-benzoquinol methylase